MGILRAARVSTALRIALVLIAITGILPQPGRAQTPTSAQLETFRNLPPDQQQALLEAMSDQNGGTVRRDPQLTTSEPLMRPREREQQAVDLGPPRIGAGSTLILDVTLREAVPTTPGQPAPPALDEATRQLLTGRRGRINAGNPYRLDNQGRISLPTLAPINLSGLTDAQAGQRLNFDPRLAGLHFSVTLLPIEPVGTEALKPYGYDLFGEAPSTFAPATDIPVPVDYRVGPGDNITVELFGKKTGRYQLVVNRNGTLTIPEFGPIQVVGLTFDQVREEIDERVSQQMIGVRASVTMGELRSIRIFVVGDVNRPGTYTVSALSTITNALFVSGGVAEIGSLRNIELKRGGATVTRLDLYDLLLRGDTSKDVQLQQGDAIFVPAIGSTAAISGQIRRPAIYEFRDGATVGELVQLSGGFTPEADVRFVRVERVGADRTRTVLDIDASTPAGRNQSLLAGDIITVPKVLDDTRGVMLEGYVHRPGAYAWRQGMRLTDLLGSLEMFKLNADQRYVLIRRESAQNRRIEVVSADAIRAFQNRGGEDDPLLRSRDRVITFSRESDRGPLLAALLQELRLQTRDNQAMPIVMINGRVRAPGEYPLEPGMTAGDLIRAGGGLDDAAYATGAELTRYVIAENQARKTDVIDLELSAAAASERSADLPLRPYDVLVVKETPDWRGQEAIVLTGEVRFPGSYPIRKGETLSSVIARAGGLTDVAFPIGSVFTRQELREQEQQQIEKLASRMRSDLALMALQGAQTDGSNAMETLQAGQSLLAQLQTAEPTGRLVINLDVALRRNGGEEDIELRGGDRLMIPRLKQYVTVVGEVQNATTHVYKSGLDRNDYIELSGGTTQRADTKRIYVVRANGSVIAQESAFWFRRAATARLEPGDTVVVPIDAERMRALPLWSAVSSVVANLAISAAALASL